MSVTSKQEHDYYPWRPGTKDDIHLDIAEQEGYPRKRATSVDQDPKLLKSLSMPWEPIIKKTAAVKNVSAKINRPITPIPSGDTPTTTPDASPSSVISGMTAGRAHGSHQRCHSEAKNSNNKTSHPTDASSSPTPSTPATSPRAGPKMPNFRMNPTAQSFKATQGPEQSPRLSHASMDSDRDPPGGVLLSNFDQDSGYPSPPRPLPTTPPPHHSIPTTPKLGQGLENLIAYGSNTPPRGHPFPAMFVPPPPPPPPPAPQPIWYNPAHIIDHRRGFLHPDVPPIMPGIPPQQQQLGVPFGVVPPGVPHMSSPPSPSYDSGSTAVNSSSSSSPRFRKAAAKAAAVSGLPEQHRGGRRAAAAAAAHSRPSGVPPGPDGGNSSTCCRHWAHHAKCAFGEQCKHAHRMPRPEDLGKVGLVSYPSWYLESAFAVYSLLHWCRGSVVQYLRQYEPAMMAALDQIHAKVTAAPDDDTGHLPPLPDVSVSGPDLDPPYPYFGSGPVPGGVDSRLWMYKNGGHNTEQPSGACPYRGKAIKAARRWGGAAAAGPGGPPFGGWKQGPQGSHYRSYDIMEGAKRKGRTSQAAAKKNQGEILGF
ncbi:hypothetical protein F5X96DRAFT_685650 [Biscogniauxia mediterranea]|nr:hypothetical protein F5X96DRAFT_685650 [Biscogniauxia mediterranea]